ncbi:MAG: hypothetical protein FWH50_02640 [Coriobacteriia bacterium]|nr:hypothetical protein [Coriobacteriia bacterium]
MTDELNVPADQLSEPPDELIEPMDEFFVARLDFYDEHMLTEVEGLPETYAELPGTFRPACKACST